MFTPELALACRKEPLLLKRICWPHVVFYDRQVEIVESVRDNYETVVPAAHQMGKDFISGFIALWYFLVHNPVRVVTTSVKDDHLRVLWGEIRRYIDTSAVPLDSKRGGPLLVQSREIKKVRGDGSLDPISYMIGMVSEDPAGLAGHHARYGLMIYDEACHDDRTEVLTEGGWRLFGDLTGKERLLSMNPEDRQAEYVLPTAIQKVKYKGAMYRCEKRGASFQVTPNHNMLWSKHRPGQKREYRLAPIRTVNNASHFCPKRFKWRGESPETYTLPVGISERKFWRERKVRMDSWVEFLGWYLSEGHLTWSKGSLKGFVVSQKDPKTADYLYRLLRHLGFSPRAHQNPNTGVWNLVTADRRTAELLLQCGRYCHEKRPPEYLMKLSPDLIRVFLEAYRNGDGYTPQPGRDVIYTSSREMADAIQILAFKAGWDSSVKKRTLVGLPAPNGQSRRDGFVVSVAKSKEANDVKISRDRLELVPYDGYVYCATVPPHHTLLTRRDGVCVWSGNSGVKEEAFERTDTWAKRRLIIGNAYDAGMNYFQRAVKEGDIVDSGYRGTV